MTAFFLGAACGFGAAWLIWDTRWFWYSAVNRIPFDDIWKGPRKENHRQQS